METRAYRDKLLLLKTYRASLLSRVSELDSRIDYLKSESECLEQSLGVLKVLLEKVSTVTVGILEDVVTAGIIEVFEKNYQFKVETKNYKNRVAYNFKLVSSGNEVDLDSVGGGLINFIDIVLRLFFILKHPSGLRRVLFLDEPLANLDASRVDRAGKFIKQLVNKLGFDILMVSHSPGLRPYSDRIYTASGEFGKCKLELVDADFS